MNVEPLQVFAFMYIWSVFVQMLVIELSSYLLGLGSWQVCKGKHTAAKECFQDRLIRSAFMAVFMHFFGCVVSVHLIAQFDFM